MIFILFIIIIYSIKSLFHLSASLKNKTKKKKLYPSSLHQASSFSLIQKSLI